LAFALIASTMAGCVWRRRAAADPHALALASADARFLDRGRDPDALEDATAAWTLLLAKRARDPEVLGRLAHAAWIRAMVQPDEARVHLETGEELGWRCIWTVPAFAQRVQADGGLVTARAMETLDVTMVPCMAWTAANALDLATSRGPGGIAALRPARLLLARLDALPREAVDDHALTPWDPVPGTRAWLRGRARLLESNPLERASAREPLDESVRAAPDWLRWRLDRARAFPDTDDGPPPMPDASRWALENAAVLARWPTRAGAGPAPARVPRIDAATFVAKSHERGVVHVFATWCAPCEAELPMLQAVVRETGLPVLLVSVDPLADAASIGPWLAARGITLDVAHLPEAEAGPALRALVPGWTSALPLTVAWTRDGTERARIEGVAAEPQLRALADGRDARPPATR
jgi:thiol-disulfide isomerase/thioredoxin